jgi:hypothetical protein
MIHIRTWSIVVIYIGWVVIVDNVLLDGFHIDVPFSSSAVLKHENEKNVKTETCTI